MLAVDPTLCSLSYAELHDSELTVQPGTAGYANMADPEPFAPTC